MRKLPERLIEPIEFRGSTYLVAEIEDAYTLQAILKESASKERDAKVCSLVLYTPEGVPEFDSEEGRAEITRAPASFRRAVMEKLFDLSGLSEKAAEEIKKK
jgi:hypothetical protein